MDESVVEAVKPGGLLLRDKSVVEAIVPGVASEVDITRGTDGSGLASQLPI